MNKTLIALLIILVTTSSFGATATIKKKVVAKPTISLQPATSTYYLIDGKKRARGKVEIKRSK